MAKLTAKQERFARLVASGSTYVDAYRDAYAVDKSKETTIYPNASKLMANNKILTRVDQLRNDAAKAEGITVESSLQELDRLKKEAVEGNNYGAAIRGEELRGKLAGLYVEKTEDVGLALSDEELARSIAGEDPAAYEICLALAKGEPMDAERIAAIAARHLNETARNAG
jgi:hypothetical protein